MGSVRATLKLQIFISNFHKSYQWNPGVCWTPEETLVHLVPGPVVLRETESFPVSQARELRLGYDLLKIIQLRVSNADDQTQDFSLIIISHFGIPYPCHCPTRGNLCCQAKPTLQAVINNGQDWPEDIQPCSLEPSDL